MQGSGVGGKDLPAPVPVLQAPEGGGPEREQGQDGRLQGRLRQIRHRQRRNRGRPPGPFLWRGRSTGLPGSWYVTVI
jgi:hypothetical protein